MTVAALPEDRAIRLLQTSDELADEQVDRAEHVLLIVPRGFASSRLRKLPQGERLARLLRRAPRPLPTTAAFARLANAKNTGISLAVLSARGSTFERLSSARRLMANVLRHNPASLVVAAPGFDDDETLRIGSALAAAAQTAVFTLPSHKSKPRKPPRLKQLRLTGMPRNIDLRRQRAEAQGTNLARWLSMLPPNELTPATYRGLLETLAEKNGWGFEFLDETDLEKRGAGAFLAVGRGSTERDSGVVRLRYSPEKDSGMETVCLVGKGLCFDTGGVNLKQARWMQNMHEDMQGSAVAVGSLLAASLVDAPWAIDCWLPIVQNDIGPTAYRPQEVVHAANGTSIEVIHTDAEGRMALADTLVLAAEKKPGLMIDLATLTGACVVALTSRYSGVFCNRPAWFAPLIEAGHASGERVWPFPMDPDFDAALRSEIADVKQCSIDGDGDHILAARFLSRFVPKEIPWIHVDLSASRHTGGLAHVPTESTGFGVRFLLSLLLDQGLLEKAPE